ncbi:MAG: DUF2384 domain-containing protein [Cyclobacteriaceae bacterium]
MKDTNTLMEPAVAYGQTDFWQLAGKDISKDYIKRILTLTKMSVGDLMEIIPISIDTYKRKVTFNPSVTEKILEIEEVYRTGIEAFGDGFHDWMNAQNIALGNIKPKNLLTNSFGVRRLLSEIGRMQHGVLA